jgi:hypothetical protein
MRNRWARSCDRSDRLLQFHDGISVRAVVLSDWVRDLRTAGNLLQLCEDAQPVFARNLDHLIRTLGWTTNTEDSIASCEDALSNGMENIIERRIADLGRPRELHEG